MIWSPTVKMGLSDVMGSWKIMLMSLPRMSRICFSDRVNRSRPRNKMQPDANRPGGMGTSPIMLSAVTDLPQPDSPTRASVSPEEISRSMFRIARTIPSSV